MTKEPMMVLMLDGKPFVQPAGKVVCVGRNYAEHARELNNPIPDQPLLFIKPNTSLVDMGHDIRIPSNLGEVHYELEVALLIGRRLTKGSVQDAKSAIAGVGLGLDLTLRDMQQQLKDKGHPWERAKAFDGACPISPFVGIDQLTSWSDVNFTLSLNGELKQNGQTRDMLMPMLDLVSHISQVFTLMPGDIVLTGTPKGVGRLSEGDRLVCSLAECLVVETQVSGVA